MTLFKNSWRTISVTDVLCKKTADFFFFTVSYASEFKLIIQEKGENRKGIYTDGMTTYNLTIDKVYEMLDEWSRNGLIDH